MYLFANDGENHTRNVKQLEEMKKALEEQGFGPHPDMPGNGTCPKLLGIRNIISRWLFVVSCLFISHVA